MEPRTSLIGREPELAAIESLVRSTQLVTLLGPGGVGKTRLAVEVARRLSVEAAGGVHLVDLTPLPTGSDRDVVGDALVTTAGGTSMESVVAEIEEKPTLVVLDNCEHVPEGVAELVDALLDIDPELRILATSRVALDVDGEHVFVVDPLTPEESVALLRERAAAAGATIQSDPAVGEDLDELGRQVDGLPLALELVASRLRALHPSEVLAALRADADVLRRDRGSGRHHSLDDAVTWSYRLLDDETASFFRSLSVFPGRFDLDDVEVVVGPAFGDRITLADLLDRLVGQSLVRSERFGGSLRYRLLVPVRQLARSWSEDAGEADELDARLIDHFVAFAVWIATEGLERWDDEVMGWIFETSAELRAATRLCLEHDDDPARAFALFLPSWGIVHHREVDAVARLGNDLLRRWPEPGPDLWPEVAAITATAELGLGHLERAGELVERVLAAGDHDGLAAIVATRTLALLAGLRGDFETAVDHCLDAATRARTLGVEEFAVEADSHRGGFLGRLGRLDEAHEVLTETVVASRRSGARPVEAASLHLLAELHLEHDPDRTATYLAEIDAVLEESTSLDTSWSARLTRGELALRRGDPAAAFAWMRESLQMARRACDHRDTWRAIQSIGVAAALTFPEHRDDAARLLRSAGASGVTPAVGLAEQRRLAEALDAVADAPPSAALPCDEAVAVALGVTLAPGGDTPPADDAGPELELGPSVVRLDWRGESATFRPSKGFTDLAALLAAPRREIHVLELMGSPLDESGTGAGVDATARRQYEDRLRELQSDIHDAEDANDTGRLERAQAEFDQIVAVLSEALGLGGRGRDTGSSAEKARQAVTWRIRAALGKIDDALPSAGLHLRRSIRTGSFCAYEPESDPGWTVVS